MKIPEIPECKGVSEGILHRGFGSRQDPFREIQKPPVGTPLLGHRIDLQPIGNHPGGIDAVQESLPGGSALLPEIRKTSPVFTDLLESQMLENAVQEKTGVDAALDEIPGFVLPGNGLHVGDFGFPGFLFILTGLRFRRYLNCTAVMGSGAHQGGIGQDAPVIRDIPAEGTNRELRAISIAKLKLPAGGVPLRTFPGGG